MHRIFGVVLIVTWLPYVFTLWPLPSAPIFLVVNWGQFILGVAAGALVLRQAQRWRVVVLVSAGVFLVFAAWDYFGHLSVLETSLDRKPESFLDSVVSSKVTMALTKLQVSPGISGWFFAYHWLVMPIVQMLAFVLALVLRTSNPSLNTDARQEQPRAGYRAR